MRWHIPVVIVFASLLIYGNTLNAGFVWDDLLFIKGNSPISQLENIPGFFTSDISKGTKLPHATPYYRPLHSTAMALQYTLWGAGNVGYHAVNILLQIGIAILVFLLARRFLLSDSASLCAALLYTVHPAHAEGVAYLGSSSELQYTFCLLVAFLCYLRSRDSFSAPAFAISLGCYAAALLTKESAMTLLPLLLILETTIPEGRVSSRVVRLSPFLLVSAIYLKIRFNYVPEIAWQENLLSDRFYTSIGIVARYILNLLAPFNLKVLYDLQLKLSLLRADVVLPMLGLLPLFLLLIYLFRKSRRSFFFGSWILIGISPASGLPAILLPSPMADRYLTLSLVGYAILAGILYDALKKRFEGAGTFCRVSKVTAVSALLSLLLGGVTVQRNLLWKDHETLVRRMIFDAPEHFLGYELLGTLQGGQGNYSGMAQSYYLAEQKTLARNLALGREYLALARFDEALSLHERLMAKFSGNAEVLNGIGLSLMNKGRAPEALNFLRKAFSICPGSPEIAANLRTVETMTGNNGR
jgi:tetratricopeptide (TPR) repeat protein